MKRFSLLPWAAAGVFTCMPWNTQDFVYKHKYIYMYMLVYLLHIAICCSGRLADWPSPTESSERAAHQGRIVFLAAAPFPRTSLRVCVLQFRIGITPVRPSQLPTLATVCLRLRPGSRSPARRRPPTRTSGRQRPAFWQARRPACYLRQVRQAAGHRRRARQGAGPRSKSRALLLRAILFASLHSIAPLRPGRLRRCVCCGGGDSGQPRGKNNRKRKQPTSSGPANSTGTGNTVGPASSPPSTPSTHTPGDGLGMGGNMRHVPKNIMIYGADGTGLASSSNQMDDLEQFGDVGSLDDNVESFLSNDDGDPRDIFAALKRSPAEPKPATSKGFTFSEVNCWRTSNSKIVCCHFSSDGKILASAGHEKKAVLWNMENFQTQYMSEEHALIITDVRFRPNSSQLATSSFDRTIKLWNAAEPGFSLHTFTGHNSQVTSLDFHPKKTELLCSCDGSGEIRFWNVTQPTSSHFIKGGSAQVRFQPHVGQFLAAAAENVVSIFDIETYGKKYTLQGHNTDVQSVCWDNNGEYIASVSQDLVKVWSISSGECIHELSSNGNKFHSCVFHPSYSNLLVIGGYQSLEVWNMVKNQSLTVQAHEGLIAALAQSPVTGMVASASHDNSVKVWK